MSKSVLTLRAAQFRGRKLIGISIFWHQSSENEPQFREFAPHEALQALAFRNMKRHIFGFTGLIGHFEDTGN